MSRTNRLMVPIIFLFWSQYEYLLGINSAIFGQIEITNITCESLDASVAIISHCDIIKMKDKSSSLFINVKLKQRIANLTVHAKLLRSVSKQYRPFLYDDQIDLCEFLASGSKHFYWGYLLNSLAKTSNINHTCPYEDTIIIHGYALGGKRSKVLPLPKGNYKIDMLVTVLKIPKLKFVMCYTKT